MKSGFLSELFVSYQGEGVHVGRRHLFLRLAGCNLRCGYCDTPDSLERVPELILHESGGPVRRPNPVSVPETVELVRQRLRRFAPVEALAITGGEPLVQSAYLAALLAAGDFQVPVLLETNGVLPLRLKEVVAWIDIVSMDLKLASNTGERPFWQEHAEFLAVARGKERYVKLVVDDATTAEEVDRAADLVAAEDPRLPTFLQPRTEESGRTAISAATLDFLYDRLRSRLHAVRVLPQTHKFLGLL